MKYENIVKCQFSTIQNKEMHFHQDIEIIYVLDGSLEVSFEEKKIHLSTEDFLLVNSNVRHAYHSKDELLIGSLFIDYTMLTEIFSGEHLVFLCNSAEEKSESYEKMRYYIRQIFNYYQTSEGQGIALKNSIYYQLIYLVTSDFTVKNGIGAYDSLRGIKDERMNEIMNYIMTNFREPITLKELSEKLFLSNAYLSKYITRNFGMSFLKLVNNIRVEHAVSDLLYTDKSVLKVAMDNGFPNLAGFNHAFKECYQLAPTEYRQQMQEKLQARAEEENTQEVLEKVEQYLTFNAIEVPETGNKAVSILEIRPEKKEKLTRNWCRMINVGEAADLLRFDVREQVLYLKEKLGFTYVRFWNLWSDEMMIRLTEGEAKYNFRPLDQVLDFLISAGLKPHLELGIKRKTVLGSIHPDLLEHKQESPIPIMGEQKEFLEEFVKHITRRYTPEEVETWYVELEKNSVLQNTMNIDTYLDMFENISNTFKKYTPGIQVGGAGFTLNSMEKEFPHIIKKWKKRKCQPDFISIYAYPYLMDEKLLDAGRNPYSSDESYLYHQIDKAKELLKEQGYTGPKLLVTEWSMSLSNHNCLNDGCFKAAYMVKNYIQNYGEVKSIGYWLASDIYSESIDADELLTGGCGIITKAGIRKPAFYAMEFMNHLENHFLCKNENAIASCYDKGKYFIVCHNYKHFNFRFYAMKENEIEIEQQPRLVVDNQNLQQILRFHGVRDGRFVIKVFSVNQEFGNIQSEWKKLDYFKDLSQLEIEHLDTICQPDLRIFRAEAKDGLLEISITIAAQEIKGIVVAED